MMQNKPESCKGCPMYGDGVGYTPDELIPNATTLVLGQAPGSQEEREGKPFVGPTGELQTKHFFPLARLTRGENVSIANVLKCRWVEGGRKVDKLPPEPILPQAIEHCTSNHLRIPESIQLVIAEGAIAASWCAGAPIKVYRWRGHQLYPTRPELPNVYVVEHLTSVMRDPKLWWVAELDWRKVPRTGPNWPSMIPSRQIASPDHWDQVIRWFKDTIKSAPYVAIDTEFIGRPFGTNQPYLTMVGLGWMDAKGSVYGLQIDCETAEPWMKASFYHHLGELVSRVPVLFQNFAADMPILKRCAGIEYDSYKQVDDQMLAHAVIYCELPHDLEFLTSIYGGFYKIKHLGDNNTPENEKWASLRWLVEKGWMTPTHGDTPDLLYNWGDVLEPLMIWAHLLKAFEMDQQAYNVYKTQSIGLIPILLRSMERGIKVNKPRIMQAKVEYETKARQAQLLAEAYYGKPINLGSDDQVAYYCYTEQNYPLQLHKKTRSPTVNEDAIAVLRDYVGPDVDTQAQLTLELALARIEQGADPILEARVLYQEVQHSLDAYIYGLVRSVYTEQDDSKKKKAREKAKQVGFTIEDIVDRVYPNFAIHAQKNARWSTTGPPLAQLPGDLRDIIIPDEGECWPHWDWKGMELHFLECHSGSRILQQAHNDGIDLHTWTMCKMFSYQLPPNLRDPFGDPINQAWRDRYSLRSSGDPRRVFSKSARFEMNYGGTGATAGARAMRMGLSKQEVHQALNNLLTADVDYYRWKQTIEREVKATRIIRSFTGRPRRFLSVGKDHGTAVPAKVVREALDYPMQAGVSDLFNLTLIEVCKTYPFIMLAWQMHDAMYLLCKVSDLTPEVIEGLKAIATREVNIEGRTKRFPIDFAIKYGPSTTEI